MLKTILLLTPIYVTLFWAIVLMTDKPNHSAARGFLSKFMLVSAFIYFSHFIFFSQLYPYYYSIDVFYQLCSLAVYPLYHIYFRLLSTDTKFSIRQHAKFLMLPLVCFVLYTAGVLMADFDEYKAWIHDFNIKSTSFSIFYLKVILVIMRICFVGQVIYVILANTKIIKQFGRKSMNFYSDPADSTTLHIQLLNYSMIIAATASILLAALGRHFFENEYTGLVLASAIFSSMLFLIGWLGDRQKHLNPIDNQDIFSPKDEPNINAEQQIALIKRVDLFFEEQKVYLNSKLTIADVAISLGTNRTYISDSINKNYHQNFCSYVNQYRITHLENIIKENPELDNQELAELCGFGSLDSMRRSIHSLCGMTLQNWKIHILQQENFLE